MNELVRQAAESPLSWLRRLASMDEESLTPTEQRARTAFLAEARRLCQEEQQRAKWERNRR